VLEEVADLRHGERRLPVDRLDHVEGVVRDAQDVGIREDPFDELGTSSKPCNIDPAQQPSRIKHCLMQDPPLGSPSSIPDSQERNASPDYGDAEAREFLAARSNPIVQMTSAPVSVTYE
jgi:hypothetical protein